MALVKDAIAFMTGPFGVAFLTMFTVFSIVATYVWCRRCCCKPAVNYTAVNHGLDDEEKAFQASIQEDAQLNFFGHDELEFETNDLESIEMLQVYRSNLPGKEGRLEAIVETGLGKEDGNTRGIATGNANGDGEVEDLEALLEGEYLEDERGKGESLRIGDSWQRNEHGND